MAILADELDLVCASDVVVGQIQRYMGFAQYELAEVNQTVKGVIIGLESDLRLRRSLSVISNIRFYCCEVNFKLIQDNG